MFNTSPLPSTLQATRVRRAAVVVAHPDDETLWCGGLMLSRPDWEWQVVTICRASDSDRSGKFREVMRCYGATGHMGGLNDGPKQTPLFPAEVREMIADLLPPHKYDLILTHGPAGEYTRHRRHEECCRAVVAMWQACEIDTRSLWLFAYEDAGGDCLPHACKQASRRKALSNTLWEEKRRILIDLYGFAIDSWELHVTPQVEGFFCFTQPEDARRHLGAMEVAP